MAAGAPVYLHCASSNRVGASRARYHAEWRGGDPADDLEIGRTTGLGRLEELMIELLGLF